MVPTIWGGLVKGLRVEEIIAEGGLAHPTSWGSMLFQPTVVERVTYGAFPVVTRIEMSRTPVRDLLPKFSALKTQIRFYNEHEGTYLERLSHLHAHRSGSLEWPVKPDCQCWD